MHEQEPTTNSHTQAPSSTAVLFIPTLPEAWYGNNPSSLRFYQHQFFVEVFGFRLTTPFLAVRTPSLVLFSSHNVLPWSRGLIDFNCCI
jgi:hypothetical protein